MAIDATVGGTNANCYLTLSAAEGYFLGRLGAETWTEADQEERESALIMATSWLDTERYVGSIVSILQRLVWPRFGAFSRNGNYLIYTAIPQMVMDATCELALAILNDPSIFGDSEISDFTHLRVGDVDVTPRFVPRSALPLHVLRILEPVRLAGRGTHVIRA